MDMIILREVPSLDYPILLPSQKIQSNLYMTYDYICQYEVKITI